MKTLYLNRHAKSSWEDNGLSDFERPLNKRGERDAPLMGKILNDLVKKPDIIYSSPANRAITTAKIIANSFGYERSNIIEDDKIYDSAISSILRIISSTADKYETIMIFGHNPTFTMLSNYLSDKPIMNIPTSGFVQIDFNIKSWSEIEGNTGRLILFEYPKKHLI
jgi:phosphohistidine phosphatase